MRPEYKCRLLSPEVLCIAQRFQLSEGATTQQTLPSVSPNFGDAILREAIVRISTSSLRPRSSHHPHHLLKPTNCSHDVDDSRVDDIERIQASTPSGRTRKCNASSPEIYSYKKSLHHICDLYIATTWRPRRQVKWSLHRSACQT